METVNTKDQCVNNVFSGFECKAEDNLTGAYVLTHVESGKFYIGSTGDFYKRRYNHINYLKTNTHWNKSLQEHYNQSPYFHFKFYLTGRSNDAEARQKAFDLEQEMLDQHKGSDNLFNIATRVDANFHGLKHTDQAKEIHRKKAIDRWKDPEFREKIIVSQNEGKTNMTNEARKRRSLNIHNALIKSHASGTRVSTFGQTRSEDFCKANSSKIKEKWKDPEFRQKQFLAKIKRGGNDSYKNPATMKPVLIDNIEYPSIREASRQLDLSVQNIFYRLNRDKFKNWNYL